MFFLGNIFNYLRSSAQRMNIHLTCCVQGNYLGRAFIFAYSWNSEQIEEYLLKTVFIFESSPQDWWSVSTPLSLVLTLVLAAIPSPPILICLWGVSRMVGWAWERSRERTPEARYCSKDHREQAVREDDVSSLSEWLSWVGQLKETALGSPSAESALSFPGSLN